MDDPDVSAGCIIEALNEHVQSGVIGAMGASNWTCQRLQEANDYADEHGLTSFSFSSPNLSFAKPNEPFWKGCVSADQDTCVWHERHQFPRCCHGRPKQEASSREDFHPTSATMPIWSTCFIAMTIWERLRRAEKLASEKDVSTVQISLAYVLIQPFPTCALVGAQTVEELQSCDDGSRIQLTKMEIAWLELRSVD